MACGIIKKGVYVFDKPTNISGLSDANREVYAM